MKTTISSILFLAIIFLPACGQQMNSMTVTGPHGQTSYGRTYDAGRWIIPDKLGIIVRAQHSKEVGAGYSLKRKMGKLGKSDFDAKAHLTISFGNHTKQKTTVKIHSLYHGGKLIVENQSITISPDSARAMDLGLVDTQNFQTEFIVVMNYEIDSKKDQKVIVAKRLTFEQLDKIAERGHPNYPWFKK